MTKIVGKNFWLFQLPYDELHFHSTVKLMLADVIFGKVFEFQLLNSEQIGGRGGGKGKIYIDYLNVSATFSHIFSISSESARIGH